METISPPMTPLRQSMSPLTISPTNSYREQLQRRNSSFSSNHDRSPISIRKNRFSNASQLSNEFSAGAGAGDGMGNLADELDELDEDIDVVDDSLEDTRAAHEDDSGQGSPTDGARDSGIDVSYPPKKVSPRMRNFSKPFRAKDASQPAQEEEEQDKLPPGLEDALNNISRMTSYTSTAEDPLIPRTISLLQDLGNQANLENHAQRLTTSTNSLISHLTAQSRAVQTLCTNLCSPFTYSAPIDTMAVEQVLPLLDTLLAELPLPDPAPLKGLQKLDRDTKDVIQASSQLMDTLQMGKQMTNTASRHLRTTQAIVAELRHEREKAELARNELNEANWNDKLRNRWCAAECDNIIGGFESMCDSLRRSLEQAGNVVA